MAWYHVQDEQGLDADMLKGIRDQIDHSQPDTYWADPQLKEIFRLRLLSDPGFPWWDVSYCYGKLHDGTVVRVDLPFGQLRKGRELSEIIAAAKEDGVYAKKLGILNKCNWSRLQ